jgi:hypothetical protein
MRFPALTKAATLSLLVLLPITSHSASAKTTKETTDWTAVAARCAPAAADEPVIYAEDFHWKMLREVMQATWENMYDSPKRLQKRAYFDEKRNAYVLPYNAFNGGDVILSKRLIESVRRHIEEALRLGYIQNVFFPDMGHSHLFIPNHLWESKYSGFEVARNNEFYTQLFADPELKVLYHTAEQLKFLDDNSEPLPDRYSLWRFHTRNPVGDNKASGRLEIHHNFASKANTVGEYPGHRYYGAGFNLSASSKGCFPYTHQGKTYYFDLSLYDLPVRNSSNGGYSGFSTPPPAAAQGTNRFGHSHSGPGALSACRHD